MPESRSVKIQANLSAVAHHILDGAFTFPYAVDAHHAVSKHPEEWSWEPWSRDEIARAHEEAGVEVEPLSAEEQAALDEHAKLVAEADARLKAFRDKQAKAKAEADQAEADEAMVKSTPPVPAPKIKRPFGRKGEPTAAELKMMRDKEHEDKLAAASRGGAPITG